MIRHSDISNCCTGRQKTAGGFRWIFKNNLESSNLTALDYLKLKL